MKNETGIGYSPLTENVYLGKQNPQKRMWVGEKKDITQQFIAVMFEYVPLNTTRTITNGTDENIFINISKNKDSISKLIENLKETLESL